MKINLMKKKINNNPSNRGSISTSGFYKIVDDYSSKTYNRM